MGKGGHKLADHVKLSNRPKKPFAKKVSENRAFKRRHGITYSGPTDSKPDTTLLADLDIPPYEEICRMSEEDARRLLIKHGVLPHCRERQEFRCWGCQAIMVKQSKGFRCPSGRQCKVRGRVQNADFVWTPFMLHRRAAPFDKKPSYKTFVRSAYCLGLRIAADQAAHLTRSAGTAIKAQAKRLEHYNRWHRIALAYTEYKHAQTHRFPTEVVECDSARFGTAKVPGGGRMHTGRTLILKGRQSKQWTSQPLPAKTSFGKRGMGPESTSEVKSVIQRQTPDTALLGVDGAKAWRGAAGSRIVLEGVNHQKKIFTPASSVPAKVLKKPAQRFLKNQSRGATKGAKAYKSHYRVAGGDNAVEGAFGMVSNCLRKTNSRGRNAKCNTRTLLAQSAAALVRKAGLPVVLEAYRTYRLDLASGRLGLSPMHAWDVQSLTWLLAAQEEADVEV